MNRISHLGASSSHLPRQSQCVCVCVSFSLSLSVSAVDTVGVILLNSSRSLFLISDPHYIENPAVLPVARMQTTSRSVAGSRSLDSAAQTDSKQPALLLNPPHVFCPSTVTPSLAPPKTGRGGRGSARPGADLLQCHSRSWRTGNYCWALCQFLSAETAAGDAGQSPQGSRTSRRPDTGFFFCKA